MKRNPLRILLLAGVLFGLAVPYVVGRQDDPERVSLPDLKTDLLRKMVAAHAADYANGKSHEARARMLKDVLGGATGIAGKLTYAHKDGKPEIAVDATKLGKDVNPA